MSVDRATGLLGWTASDVRDLARRVRRQATPVAERPVFTRCEPPVEAYSGYPHSASHVVARIGPYLICRDLWCSTIVVGVAQ